MTLSFRKAPEKVNADYMAILEAELEESLQVQEGYKELKVTEAYTFKDTEGYLQWYYTIETEREVEKEEGSSAEGETTTEEVEKEESSSEDAVTTKKVEKIPVTLTVYYMQYVKK